MIGDTVNFAARLEALNKEFDSQFLISADVHDALGEDGKGAVSLGDVRGQGLRPADGGVAIGVGSIRRHPGTKAAPPRVSPRSPGLVTGSVHACGATRFSTFTPSRSSMISAIHCRWHSR